jgi:predicted glycosyltransferase involved in capsule biosynthesis
MNNIYKDLRSIGVRLNECGHIHKDDVAIAEPLLLKYVTSTPYLIPDTEFDLENPPKNFQKYCELAKKNGVVVHRFKDYELVRYASNIALLQPQNKHVSYLVKFQQLNMFGKKSVTQVLLWREQPNKFVADARIDGLKLTAYVFFKILFAENDCIVTDGSQTEMGKRFWIDRIADAWDAGFPVYYVNQKQDKKILLTPDNFNELRISEEIWGAKKQDSVYKKIAICKDYFW